MSFNSFVILLSAILYFYNCTSSYCIFLYVSSVYHNGSLCLLLLLVRVSQRARLGPAAGDERKGVCVFLKRESLK